MIEGDPALQVTDGVLISAWRLPGVGRTRRTMSRLVNGAHLVDVRTYRMVRLWQASTASNVLADALLGRSPQTIRNTLCMFRQLERAESNLDLAIPGHLVLCGGSTSHN
jgi:hypothetical protein